MSDITELFRTVGPDGAGDPAAATVDGDLTRGRTALVRAHRRAVVRRSMFATGSLVVAAAVAVTATQLSGGSSNAPTTSAPNHSVATPVHHHKSAVRLVDWTGKQLNGFNVDAVPAGWQLSTSTQYALLITADGSTDKDPDAFEGKLAVLTSSVDEHGLGSGDPVTVNGQAGRVDDQGGTLLLRYNSANGFGIDIQAPPALHWSDAQIVAFAEGVHVTGDAVHSHG
jgi:hypothetical protein